MKTQITKDIEQCFMKEFSKMGSFICNEVGINIKRYGYPNYYFKNSKMTEQEMVDKGWVKSWHIDTEIVDMLEWQSGKNIWKCYEIKVAEQDFKSSASKTFVGNYNYYIVPEYLYNRIEKEVPTNIGIYIYKNEEPKYNYEHRIVSYRKAKKQELKCTLEELYYGLIKSLYREIGKFRN